MTTERRQDPRAEDLGIEATVLARHNPGVTFSIENISVGGCSLVGAITLAIGERVQILFEVDDTPIDVSAEVVRADHLDILNDRISVMFIDVREATREMIQRLVARALELACDQIEHGA
jgi:c-di-GMP-binding flagellar brake protein YcgR